MFVNLHPRITSARTHKDVPRTYKVVRSRFPGFPFPQAEITLGTRSRRFAYR